MENISISIIMPIYNVANYLNIMLDSLYNQTFRDFELIVVNDGSTDNSMEIVDRYKLKYNNITILNQKNRGPSEARNNAIKYIKGKYTIFLDSDDYMERDMLEKMYRKAEKNNLDIIICEYKKVYDYKNNSKDKIIFDADENKIYSNIEVMEMMLDEKVKGYLWNKMFLSKNIFKSNIQFEKGRLVEDVFPVYKLVSMAKKIMFINGSLYNYRQRATSSLHGKSIKLIEDYIFAYSSILKYSDDFPDISKEKYYKIIDNIQAVPIHDLVLLGERCNRYTYKQYSVLNMNIFEIMFRINCEKRVKFRLLLYKLRVLHYYYKVSI